MDTKTGIINLIDIGAICDYKLLDELVNKAMLDNEITNSNKDEIYKYMDKIMNNSNEELKINKS